MREYVACAEGVEPPSVRVRITVRFGNSLDDEVAAARADLEHAERAQRDAAARSRRLALRLREAGLSGADIAVVLRVSPQRVSQLVRGRLPGWNSISSRSAASPRRTMAWPASPWCAPTVRRTSLVNAGAPNIRTACRSRATSLTAGSSCATSASAPPRRSVARGLAVGGRRRPSELIGPGDTDDESLRLLLRAVFAACGGTHDDWDTYDRVMREEGRVAVLVTPARVYGNA